MSIKTPSGPDHSAPRQSSQATGLNAQALVRQLIFRTLGLGLAIGLLGACAAPEKSGLYVHNAYIKTAIPGKSMTAAYAAISNHDPEAICLTHFSARFAQTIELHITENIGDPDSGRVAMRHLPRMCIEPGQQAVLAPGGMHLMVMGLEEFPPVTDSPPAEVTIVLGTASGRAFETQFEVVPFNR